MVTYLRVCFTLVNLKNLITVKSKTSLESIVNFKRIEFGTIKIAIQNYSKDHLKRFPLKLRKYAPQGIMTSLKEEYSEKKGFTPPYPPFYFSLKSGPNGKVLSTRPLDAQL
jgi:hypothetical protein